MHELRLECAAFWVDVRLRQVRSVWLASADTPDGPMLAPAADPLTAVRGALEPFDGVVDELLESFGASMRPIEG